MQKTELKSLIEQTGYTLNCASLDVSATYLPDGRLSAEYPGVTIESFFIRNESSPYLYVLFSGARDPKRHPLPKFDRWSWGEKFNASILCISDPTLELDKDLHIGWYLGTKENNYMTHIASWVSFVAQNLGISQEKVITYGSSAGGFASIMLTYHLEKSVAIAINPQLNVFRYFPRFVEAYLDCAYAGKRQQDLTTHEYARFDAIAAIQSRPKTKFILAQNIQDGFHYKNHFSQLCKALNIPNDPKKFATIRAKNITTILFDSPNGHGSEPIELVPALVSLATGN